MEVECSALNTEYGSFILVPPRHHHSAHHPIRQISIMARSHCRFSQVSDFLGSEAVYLDIFTLAIFPSDFYIYLFVCLQKSLT